MHPTKRIKLDASTSKLTRPFRSPLRSPNRADLTADANESKPSTRPCNQTPAERDLASVVPSPNTLKTSSSSPVLETSKTAGRVVASSPILPPATHNRINDGELTALEKQYRAHCLQLKQLQHSLDTAQQALKIETSGHDAELGLLVVKWRSIARDAAEELFSVAKDRVNKMGGLGVWREKAQRQPDGWDYEPEADLDRLTDEQKEQMEVQKEEALVEAQRYGPPPKKIEQEFNDDDSFTIDMMLKQLNVDLDVIGYNKQQQHWQD